jgi:hypothetical protein
MKIRKAHILARHVNNMEDDSAGIFYTEEGGGMDFRRKANHHPLLVAGLLVVEYRGMM